MKDLFTINVKGEIHLEGIEEPQAEVEIIPSDYLDSLPLDKKIEELNQFLEQSKEELENLKNPLIQMHEGIGLLHTFKDGEGYCDKPTAIGWLEGNILAIETLLHIYSHEES